MKLNPKIDLVEEAATTKQISFANLLSSSLKISFQNNDKELTVPGKIR